MNDKGFSFSEIREGKRFPFGANWISFLDNLDERRITESTDSLRKALGDTGLRGKTFLDAGCGSGIHSLAARTLGAKVVSFDFDPLSVKCAVKLRDRVSALKDDWQVLQGSVLDPAFLASLGTFEVVYSWGVLHHTGSLWKALDNVSKSVALQGILFIAIYNDQGWLSHYWRAVKMLYNRGAVLRWLLIAIHFPYLVLGRVISNTLKRKPSLKRGMSYWIDMKDWLGGLPFEVARPEKIVEYLRLRGFVLEKVRTCGGRPGCNEFLLRKGVQ